MNRKLLWAVLAIGLALVIAPLAMSLPSKANAGERMLNGFQPIMQPDQVKTTAYYYNQVFVPLGKVTPMMSAANVAKFQGYMKGFQGMGVDGLKLLAQPYVELCSDSHFDSARSGGICQPYRAWSHRIAVPLEIMVLTLLLVRMPTPPISGLVEYGSGVC